jgi:hypothetical protein
MQDLRVIGVENGALLLSDDHGTRFRVDVDQVLQANLRPSAPDLSGAQKLAPREIQAQIRAGMSAEDVATLTGAPLESIQRYEGPIVAEREYIVESALAVPVQTAYELDPLPEGANFGSAIRGRLADLDAEGERWASWKELDAGWIVKLSFTANEIDHDARWRFEPKKLTLEPLNNEAVQLSQQGESSSVLIPRLRAVHPDERRPDAARFDSGAFDFARVETQDTSHDEEPALRNATQPLPEPVELNQTADLLEALRRRRGEREAANFEGDAPVVSPMHPSTGSIRVISEQLDMPIDEPVRSSTPQPVTSASSTTSAGGASKTPSRKGRQSMPSWDEIVFGARPDDDLA